MNRSLFCQSEVHQKYDFVFGIKLCPYEAQKRRIVNFLILVYLYSEMFGRLSPT